jgi:hypothetical protein
MLTYETISDALLDSAEHVGLNVWQTDEQLDPQTLNRTLTLRCLTQGEATPRNSSLQASISFSWDAAMTAISTMGTDAICAKFHGDNVACSHGLAGCAYEATLTLEVGYTVPLQVALGDSIDSLQHAARSIQDLHRSIIDHKNVVVVDGQISLDRTGARAAQIVARQRWTIGDPIHELDGLEDVFEEACSEVRDMLMALSERFNGDSRGEGDDVAPLMLPLDPADDEDRIYLRPPTA